MASRAPPSGARRAAHHALLALLREVSEKGIDVGVVKHIEDLRRAPVQPPVAKRADDGNGRMGSTRRRDRERVNGIEPSSEAWKAPALPLSYTRVRRQDSRSAQRDGERRPGSLTRCRKVCVACSRGDGGGPWAPPPPVRSRRMRERRSWFCAPLLQNRHVRVLGDPPVLEGRQGAVGVQRRDGRIDAGGHRAVLGHHQTEALLGAIGRRQLADDH